MSLSERLRTSRLGDILFRRMPLIYGRKAALLNKVDGPSRQGFDATATDRLLHRTLRRAAKSGYGKHLGNVGDLRQSLASWPVLDKDTLRADPEQFAMKTLLPCARAQTGGTTGVPLRLTRSLASLVYEQAVIDMLARRAGTGWDDARIAVLRGDSIKDPTDLTPPYWVDRRGGRELVMSCNHITATTVSSYIQALHDFAPDILWVYPTGLEALLRHARAQNLTLPPIALVFSSSEVLPDHLHHLAEEMLGARVCDYYGQAERVCASYAFTAGEHYFLASYGAVELIFDHQAQGDEGSLFDHYRIVATPYHNDAMALIRYETGDFARLPCGLSPEQRSEVEQGTRPFLGVTGRQGDYLISPDGAHLMGIDHIPRGIAHVAQMQFVQDQADRVEILVVPLDGYGQPVRDHILRNAAAKLPASMHITITEHPAARRTARGKAPMIFRSETLE